MLSRFLTLILLLLAAPAWGAVSFDAQTATAVQGASGTSHAHTVGGGCTNTIVVVTVASFVSGGTTVNALTIGGNSATQIGGTTDESRRLEVWYRKGVSTGSNTVAVTMNATADLINTSARSYCGVDQVTPLGTPTVTYDPGNGQPSISVSGASGDMIIDSIVSRIDGALTLTVGGGQTQRYNANDDAGVVYIVGESDETAVGASTTMSWTQTGGADTWSMVGVALKPSTAAVAVKRRRPIVFQ